MTSNFLYTACFFSLKPDTLSIRSGHTYIKIKLKKSIQYWNTHVHIYETNLEKNPKTNKTKYLNYFKLHICFEEHFTVTTFTIMLKQFTMKIHHMNIHNIALWIFSHNSDSLNPLLRSIHHHTSNGLLWFFILVHISQSNTKMSVQQTIMDICGRCFISLEEIVNIKPALGTVQNN